MFTRTKHGANRLSQQLEKAGIGSAAIHGNKSQSARERALGAFKAGTTRVLVATDVAARGIDVDGISHVINFDLPNVARELRAPHRPHRARGRRGFALSFCDRRGAQAAHGHRTPDPPPAARTVRVALRSRRGRYGPSPSC